MAGPIGGIKKLPKRTVVIAMGVGGVIGLILYVRGKNKPQTPDNQTTDTASPDGGLPTDPNSLLNQGVAGAVDPNPPDSYWDFLSTVATVNSPAAIHDPPGPPPKIHIVATRKNDHVTKQNITLTGGGGINSEDLLKQLGLFVGGPPKGKVVKSKGHPTHKKHHKHHGKGNHDKGSNFSTATN